MGRVPFLLGLFGFGLSWVACTNDDPDACVSERGCPEDNRFCEPRDENFFHGTCEEKCSEETGDRSAGSGCNVDSDCNSGNCDNDTVSSPCECVGEGTGGSGGRAGAGGSSGSGGGSGGIGGIGGIGGSLADVFADLVDGDLTDINDVGCLGNCIGEPANATGAPDFEDGPGNLTHASLGPGGTLGLVFLDELCVVDGDRSTPDIIVYERGGIQIEDFSLRVVLAGEEDLVVGMIDSNVSDDQPKRRLDLTDLIDGPGMVKKVQIIDIDGPPDEPEDPDPDLAPGYGADIDAVACFSR